MPLRRQLRRWRILRLLWLLRLRLWLRLWLRLRQLLGLHGALNARESAQPARREEATEHIAVVSLSRKETGHCGWRCAYR